MKRSIFLAIALGVALMGVTAIALAQTPSVPNLINFQGRLTDLTGNPVANGAHTVNFSIWTDRTAGISPWSETQTPTTTGGLFTTQLGLVNALPISLFEDYDSLFLEIVADGNLISPRTLLTSTPSARVANALEVPSAFDPTKVGVKISPYGTGHHIEIESATDGLFNQQHGGIVFGESWWSNGAPSHFVTARIGAYPGSGGELALTDDLLNPRIDLNGGLLGDASVFLPTDAVNSGEIFDEAGIASGYNSGIIIPLGVPIDLDSAIITVPSAGYIVIIASAIDYPSHTTGTRDVSRYSISTVSAATDFAYLTFVTTPAVVATDFDMPQSVAVHRIDVVGGPGTYRYYFTAEEFSGTCNTYQPKLTAMYFPTLYGTVDVTPKPVAKPITTPSDNSLGSSKETVNAVAVQHITVEDHNARLEAERAKQMAELEARIKRLETQAAGQLPGQGVESPRKER